MLASSTIRLYYSYSSAITFGNLVNVAFAGANTDVYIVIQMPWNHRLANIMHLLAVTDRERELIR